MESGESERECEGRDRERESEREAGCMIYSTKDFAYLPQANIKELLLTVARLNTIANTLM